MRASFLSLILISLLTAAGPLAAQEGSTAAKKRSGGKSTASNRGTPLTEEQTDRALAFAEQHHAELADLLRRLRDNAPAGFKRGVREVHRTVQRLERVREKQPVRYTRELNRWKTDSRIRLMTARWLMSQDPELEQQIKDLLRERQRIQLEQLQADRDRAALRLKQLDDQIARTSDEQYLQQEWKRLQKRSSTGAGSRRLRKKKQQQE